MRPDLESRLEELFHRLAPLPPDERTLTLNLECSGDDDLREHLDALLQAHDEENVLDESLDVAGLHVGATNEIEGDPPGPGDFVGPFRVVEVLGHGGMGTVCLAEQLTPVHRRVAVKLIRGARVSEELRSRFEAERQALALLDSPYIARILDIGSTEDGRPFYAMEYVAGVPATAYADHHGLSVRKRLDLFLRVCEGIHHAHQKGIIHRDIKPSNVLVMHHDDGPVVKIIDFGIAKVLGPFPAPTHRTQHGVVLGTPEYMSPEAASGGRDVDTRSDVYSAGVLLYELLSGNLPSSRHDEERRLSHPPKRVLERELKWICRKALEEDRADRYQTISELAEDVRRAMTHQPVLAGPPSARYRLKKFLRRNRAAVTAGAAFLVMLAVTAVVSTTFYLREQEARVTAEDAVERAERERRRVDAVGDFWRRVFAQLSTPHADGPTKTRAEALTFAIGTIDDAALLDVRDQAAVRLTLGNLCWRQGDREAALRLLEDAAKRFETMSSPDAYDYAECLLALGNAAAGEGDSNAAVGYVDRALETAHGGLDAHSLDSIFVHVNGGKILAGAGAREKAQDVLRGALEAARRAMVPEGLQIKLAQARLQGLVALQRELLETGGLVEVRGVMSETESVARDAGLLDKRLQRELLLSEAHLHRLLHRWPEAAAAYDSTVQLFVELYGHGFPATLLWKGRLAEALARDGKFDRATTILDEALTSSLEGSPSTNTVASMLSWFRAEVSRMQGRFDLAERDYERAADGFHAKWGDQPHDWYGWLALGRGRLEMARGQIAAAERHFARAYETFLSTRGERAIESLESAYWLARAHADQGRFDEAEHLMRLAYEGFRLSAGDSATPTMQARELIEFLSTSRRDDS